MTTRSYERPANVMGTWEVAGTTRINRTNHSGTRPNGDSSTAGEAIARVSPDKETRKWRLPLKEVTRFSSSRFGSSDVCNPSTAFSMVCSATTRAESISVLTDRDALKHAIALPKTRLTARTIATRLIRRKRSDIAGPYLPFADVSRHSRCHGGRSIPILETSTG